jgi:hypothetical protein
MRPECFAIAVWCPTGQRRSLMFAVLVVAVAADADADVDADADADAVVVPAALGPEECTLQRTLPWGGHGGLERVGRSLQE